MAKTLVSEAALYTQKGYRAIPNTVVWDLGITSLQKGLGQAEVLFVLASKVDKEITRRVQENKNELSAFILERIAKWASLILTSNKLYYVVETHKEIPLPLANTRLSISPITRDQTTQFLDKKLLESLGPPIRKIGKDDVFKHARGGFIVIFNGFAYDDSYKSIDGKRRMEMTICAPDGTVYRLRFRVPKE